jgi:hypothetical protein
MDNARTSAIHHGTGVTNVIRIDSVGLRLPQGTQRKSGTERRRIWDLGSEPGILGLRCYENRTITENPQAGVVRYFCILKEMTPSFGPKYGLGDAFGIRNKMSWWIFLHNPCAQHASAFGMIRSILLEAPACYPLEKAFVPYAKNLA